MAKIINAQRLAPLCSIIGHEYVNGQCWLCDVGKPRYVYSAYGGYWWLRRVGDTWEQHVKHNFPHFLYVPS